MKTGISHRPKKGFLLQEKKQYLSLFSQRLQRRIINYQSSFLLFLALFFLISSSNGLVAETSEKKETEHERKKIIIRPASIDESDYSKRIQNEIYNLTFSKDGKLLFSGGRDGTIRTFDLQAKKEIKKINCGKVRSLAICPEKKLIAISSDAIPVRLCEWSERKIEFKQLKPALLSCAVEFSSDGKYLLAGAENGSVHLWNLKKGKSQQLLKQDRPVWSVALSPAGKTALVTTIGSRRVPRIPGILYILDVQTQKVIKEIKSLSPLFTSTAFSPDGKSAAVVDFDNGILVFSVSIGKQLQFIPTSDVICFLEFSPDGKYLLSGGGTQETGQVRLWDVLTGNLLHVFEGISSCVTIAAYSPDGRLFAAAGSDNSIQILTVPSNLVTNTKTDGESQKKKLE